MTTTVQLTRRLFGVMTTCVLMSGLLVVTLFAGSAAADTAPVDPATPETVSSDALPTVQVNGVVWDQVVVGNRVYATGSFTSARPAGSPVGTNETPRSNILAYDITTGNLVTSWAPSLNAEGKSITASPDGSKIYVVGSFTSVSGVGRFRIAALDANTGAVITGFSAGTNARVRTVVATADTLYVGGIFSNANNQARTRLAAFNATTGAILSWAPVADSEVMSMTVPAGTNKVVVGGNFQNLNGAPWYGMGALDGVTGATLPWAATSVVRNAGANAAILNLTSDNGVVYGTGYTFGAGGNLENSFSANASDGSLRWVSGCRGDTYEGKPIGGVYYTVGHTHDCSQIGELPQTNPWTFQRAYPLLAGPASDGRLNVGGSFPNRPAPEMLHWLPDLEVGTVTGQSQAAWTVDGNADYVVLGGEFPTVNGRAQQGLVRFARRGVAPNTDGAQGGVDLTPTFTAQPGTGLRLSWITPWDRDNKRLTYEVLRGPNLAGSTVIGKLSSDSTWWLRGSMSFVDYSAPAGSSQTYRIRVTDPVGNVVVGNPATGSMPATLPPASAYRDRVRTDGAVNYWRLGETAGTTANNIQGADNLTLAASATRNQTGALTGDPDTATTFPGGTTGVPGATQVSRRAPQQFSVEAWVKTTSTQGGKIVGFGNSATGNSGTYDRHLYMTNTGQIYFGVNPGVIRTVNSTAAYNNGAWHHVVGTLGPAGMTLYVDGAQVAQRADTTRAMNMSGFWRVGGDNLTSWPTRPTQQNLQGTIDDVATYLNPLTAAQVQAHYQVGGSGTPANAAPTAAFTATPNGLAVAVDGSASTDTDGTVTGYAWDFGDGGTATGATASHTYAAAGTFQVKLTVTDNGGATGTLTKPVTVSAGTQPSVFAADAFGRTIASGWGSADSGGAWTTSGPGYSVSGGAGNISVTPGATKFATLGAVSQSDTDLTVAVSLDKAQTGGGTYLYVTGRKVGTSGEYRARLRFLATGEVTAQLSRVVGSTDTILSSATVTGLTYTPGATVQIRFQATGSGTTTLRAKAWAGGAEPSAWLLSTTDTTAALQAPGSVALGAFLSGSATTTPMVVSFDNLSAARTSTP